MRDIINSIPRTTSRITNRKYGMNPRIHTENISKTTRYRLEVSITVMEEIVIVWDMR